MGDPEIDAAFRETMLEMASEDCRIAQCIGITSKSFSDDSEEADVTAPFAEKAKDVLEYYGLSGREDADQVLVRYIARRVREGND